MPRLRSSVHELLGCSSSVAGLREIPWAERVRGISVNCKVSALPGSVAGLRKVRVLSFKIIRDDVEEAIARFQSKHPVETMEAAPLPLVGTLLGILHFTGLLVWVHEASEEG